MSGRRMYLRGNTDHRRCAALIKDMYAKCDTEVNVSDWRAGMRMPDGLTDVALVCPHGIRMWAEPTREQLMKWDDEETEATR